MGRNAILPTERRLTLVYTLYRFCYTSLLIKELNYSHEALSRDIVLCSQKFNVQK
jgi:hypothetical protein